MARLEFWFDFASTYSYVAAMRIEALAAGRGVEIAWRPFILGPIFQRQGWNDSPFNLYPARGRYMWRDLERLCERHGLPFRRPTRFPRHTVLAARVGLLCEEEPWIGDLVRAIFRANFVEDRDISEPALLAAVLDALGRDGASLVEKARSPENKQRLRERTEIAWDRGIFGAPSFVVEGELFWGQDRLEQALEWPHAT